MRHHIIVPLQLKDQIFKKRDCSLNCCSDFPGMNELNLQSPEKFDSLFPDYIHNIRFHIFQNISKCFIQGL